MNQITDLRSLLVAAGYRTGIDPPWALAGAVLRVSSTKLLELLKLLEPCAEECMERRLDARVDPNSLQIVRLLHEVPEVLEFAVIAFLASLVDSALPPSGHIYPAAMLVDLLRKPKRPSAVFAAIAHRVGGRLACWRPACDLAELLADRLVGNSSRWPSGDDCRALATHLATIMTVWQEEAREYEAGARPFKDSNQRRAIGNATLWCVSLHHMLVRLEYNDGWIQLLGDYLFELIAGTRRKGRLTEVLEVVLDDLGVVLFSVAGNWSRLSRDESPFLLLEAGVQAFPAPCDPESAHELQLQCDRRRKSLSRARARCLALWTVTPPRKRWTEEVLPNLRELALRLECEQELEER